MVVRRLPLLLSVLLLTGLLAGLGAPPAGAGGDPADGPVYRRITFPVDATVSYSDTFGACRDGCTRYHEGQDLMGAKLMPLVSAVNGTVVWLRNDGSGRSGNMLAIQDSRGWEYRYIHINNDTPGTDDGLNPARWGFGPGIKVGAEVTVGQLVAYMGDSGNAEWTSPHLHFEIRRPDGSAVNPWTSLRLAQGLPAEPRCTYDTNPRNEPVKSAGPGYWVAGPDGAVFSYGNARYYGGMGGRRLNAPMIGHSPTPTAKGYWLLGRDGGVFSFGDSKFYGSTGDMILNAPIVGMAPSAGGKGYWLLGRDGGVFSFGDARFYGSTGDMNVGAAMVSMAVTPTGKGYWLVTARGRVYAFGDARSRGGAAGLDLGSAVVSITPTSTGRGYWLLTANGQVLRFGDAVSRGSVSQIGLCSPSPAVGLAATRTGRGYWVLQADGRVRRYGDAYLWGRPSDSGGRGAAISAVPAPPAG